MKHISPDIINIKKIGEYAILIEWEPVIRYEILQSITLLDHAIKIANFPDFLESIPGYSSLTLLFKVKIIQPDEIIQGIKRLKSKLNAGLDKESETIEIPVCYDSEFALDRPIVEELTGLEFDDIIKIHSNSTYLVHFIGFMPGFMYLGGLDLSICIPRKITPRLRVPAGSVGIAGEQTGIYPSEKPGGWQIIGRSPIQLFDPFKSPPCVVRAGDKVRFKAISKIEFNNFIKK